MNYLNNFGDFVGSRRNPARRPSPAPHPQLGLRPRPQPASRPKPLAAHIRPETGLMVSKAIAQFDFVNRAWNLNLWRDAANKAEWQHDLKVMLDHRDLSDIGLEVLSHDDRVIFRDKIHFGSQAKAPRHDTAGGVELPLLDRSAIKSARIVVWRLGNGAACRHLLKLPWESAAEIPEQPGDRIVSEHAAAITGGRQTGELHVGASARHRIEVTQTGDRQFAFARDLDHIGLTHIFLHTKFAPPGFVFRVGQQLTAVLIAGPKGIQARSIRIH